MPVITKNINLQDNLLEQLEKMLAWKKSKQYYATQLGISVEEVTELINQSRNKEEPTIADSSRSTFTENLQGGTAELTTILNREIHTLDELIEETKIDISIWEITKYVTNFWGNSKEPHWQVKAFLSKKSPDFGNKFEEFLRDYKSPHKLIQTNSTSSISKKNGKILINKQDSHLNKYSIQGGNDINDRFDAYFEAVSETVHDAKQITNLEEIVYVIGSDQFNSEWTNLTTKGTPQQNLPIPYEATFQLICNQETRIIDSFLSSAQKVKIIYIGGNHDKYASWHMVSWLKAYYHNQKNLEVDITPDFTKYISMYNTAICLNHGDAQKMQRLAQNFPFEYKDGFFKANQWIVIIGDKHVEKTEQYGAVKCYQIPLQSKAVSEWDSKNGFTTSPAEILSFLFKEGKGFSNIIRQPL